MFYTEAYKQRQELESSLLSKWEPALNANGGVANEHLARATAILCENYLTELKGDPRLIAEDRVQTGAFRGVNLALLGLITRVIPALVGAELVGVQAMPTPKSPIFTMTWHKSATKGFTTGNTGSFPNLPDGDELWVTPIPDSYAEFGGVDPYYSSNQVYEKKTKAQVVAFAASAYEFAWAKELDKMDTKGYLYPESVVVYFLDSTAEIKDFATYGPNGNYLARAYITGGLNGLNEYVMLFTDVNGVNIPIAAADLSFDQTANPKLIVATGTWPNIITAIETASGKVVGNVIFSYQYDAEDEGNIPEIEFKISEEVIGLTRRQLRGKYTVDAVQDLKVLHGINLDSELVNMMKNELMHEINHEIVTDLRKLAYHVKELDFNDFVNYTAGTAGAVTTGNYDDAAKLALDAINRIAASIWVKGRMGYGNFVVGNPITLSYLDRVPGFVGSGVTYSGRDLSYAGSVGGKLKIYHDPTFPEDELLIGYKGGSALETGYLYCPYLPITATPTLYNPTTGDPSKIFYTRYSKTLKESGSGLTRPKSVILNGELQYARLKLTNYPGSKLFG